MEKEKGNSTVRQLTRRLQKRERQVKHLRIRLALERLRVQKLRETGEYLEGTFNVAALMAKDRALRKAARRDV